MMLKHLNGFSFPFIITAFIQALSYITLIFSFDFKSINSFALFATPLLVTYATDNLYSFLSFRFNLSPDIIIKEENDIKLINVIIILISLLLTFFHIGLNLSAKVILIGLMWWLLGGFLYLQLITRFLNFIHNKSHKK